MSLQTFNDLLNSITSWIHRDDVGQHAADFVVLCESRLNRMLRLAEQETRAVASISTDYIGLPADFAALRDIQINSSSVWSLQYKSPSEINDISNRGAGEPHYYTIIDEQIQVAPSPDGSYPIEIVYFAKIPALSGTNTTNWLLTKAPDLYLFGSLVEARSFLVNDERAAFWDARFKQALAEVQGLDQAYKLGASPLQMTLG
jgi:hypothetical protein